MAADLHIRVAPAFRKRLEELAEARGESISQTIRSTVMAASVPEHASPVPDEQEVLELLGGAARAGSVSAMKELRAYYRDERSEESGVLDMVDELAAWRTREADHSRRGSVSAVSSRERQISGWSGTIEPPVPWRDAPVCVRETSGRLPCMP